MGILMDRTPGDPTDPIARFGGGDRHALRTLFDQYSDRLRRMMDLRLDPRLRARLEVSNVIQEAFLDVASDLDACLAESKLPPLLGLRLHVGRRLAMLHRRHLGLDPIDREMLALRHFEQLGRAEAAQVLGITQEAGAKRYFRAEAAQRRACNAT
jgi:RNA polymerase sigma-70 factor (ECF subfamily)